MEKRIGSCLILVENPESISKLNSIISKHASVIIGRQGVPVREKNISIISLILEGTTDEIGSLTGQIGRLQGVQVKSIIAKSI